jgi:hypothetical protein
MTKAQLRRRASADARLLGPRVPGGRYRSGYWGQEYTVLAVWSDLSGWPYVRVQWADGHTVEHCTPWDARADQVVS